MLPFSRLFFPILTDTNALNCNYVGHVANLMWLNELCHLLSTIYQTENTINKNGNLTETMYCTWLKLCLEPPHVGTVITERIVSPSIRKVPNFEFLEIVFLISYQFIISSIFIYFIFMTDIQSSILELWFLSLHLFLAFIFIKIYSPHTHMQSAFKNIPFLKIVFLINLFIKFLCLLRMFKLNFWALFSAFTLIFSF